MASSRQVRIAMAPREAGKSNREDTVDVAAVLPNPKLALDKKTEFWEEYDRHATKYDAELVKGLGDDLNSLLIFAALFSASNTAFMIESVSYLRPDPAEITNDLLRTLIRNMHDPSMYQSADIETQGFKASYKAVRCNVFFFTSLSCSLFTAFGAMMGKQWLNTYENDGPPRPLSEKCRERQMKLKGVEKWYLEGIIQTLPALLQLSLFLFLAGLTDWMWRINVRVAVVVLTFSGVTFIFYTMTSIISICDPSSPFQSRLSRYLRKVLTHVGTSITGYIDRVSCSITNHGFHSVWTWPLILVAAMIFPRTYMNETPPSQVVKSLFSINGRLGSGGNYLKALIKAMTNVITFVFTRTESLNTRYNRTFGQLRGSRAVDSSRYLNYKPSPAETVDLRGAECLLWLLEQQWRSSGSLSTHVIDAVIALDATALETTTHQRPQTLKRLLLAILEPRKINRRWILDIETQKLQLLVGSLSHVLSLSPGNSGVILEDEAGNNCDTELWSMLCHKLWRMAADTSSDHQLLVLVSRVLNSKLILNCNIDPPPAEDVTFLEEKLSPHLRSIVQLNSSQDEITSHRLNCLTVLSCAYVTYIRRCDSVDWEIFGTAFASAMYDQLESNIRTKWSHDAWRDRFYLLWLNHHPPGFISYLHPILPSFASFLQNWEEAEGPFWKNPNRPARACHRSIYLRTLRILLNQEHMAQELQPSLSYLQDLLDLKPLNYPNRHAEVDLVDQALKSKRGQLGWGNTLLPLVAFMAIWSDAHEKDPQLAIDYQTPDWIRAVRNAVIGLAEVRFVSINHFCDDITPQEVLDTMKHLVDYAQPWPTDFLPWHEELVTSFDVLGEQIASNYDPAGLQYSTRRRLQEALSKWDEVKETWKEEVQGYSESLKRAPYSDHGHRKCYCLPRWPI